MTRRLLKRLAAAVLGLLLLFGAALWGMLGTQAGSRWLLAQVPGLQVDNFRGRLGSAWQADALLWQQGEMRVELQQLDMAWSPSCLLRLTLCIDRLHLQQTALDLPPSTEPSSEPLSLPSLNLPLRLQLGDIRLGELRLDGEGQLSDLELIASWNEQGVELQRLALQRDDLRLDLSGSLTPQGDWPLALSGRLQLPEVDGQPWQVALQIGGELQRSLQLEADSRGYLEAHLQGSVQALAEHLPAEVRLTSREFQASSDLPATLRLQDVQQLVLDEADRLLDLGFADELQRVLSLLPAQRQTLLFSATYADAVQALAQGLLHDPVRVTVEAVETQAPDIRQRAIAVDEKKRTALLRHLMTENGWKRVLVIDGAEVNENFARAARNIEGVDILPSMGANVYDILKRDTLVITRAGVEALEARLK